MRPVLNAMTLPTQLIIPCLFSSRGTVLRCAVLYYFTLSKAGFPLGQFVFMNNRENKNSVTRLVSEKALFRQPIVLLNFSFV